MAQAVVSDDGHAGALAGAVDIVRQGLRRLLDDLAALVLDGGESVDQLRNEDRNDARRGSVFVGLFVNVPADTADGRALDGDALFLGRDDVDLVPCQPARLGQAQAVKLQQRGDLIGPPLYRLAEREDLFRLQERDLLDGDLCQLHGRHGIADVHEGRMHEAPGVLDGLLALLGQLLVDHGLPVDLRQALMLIGRKALVFVDVVCAEGGGG